MIELEVYAAGPITGQNYEGATGWREDLQELVDGPIRILDPMRHKQYLLEAVHIADSYEESILSSQRAIVSRDRYDVERCDVLAIYLPMVPCVSIGSMFELSLADYLRKPIVGYLAPGSRHDHAFVREAITIRVKSLEQMAEALNGLL